MENPHNCKDYVGGDGAHIFRLGALKNSKKYRNSFVIIAFLEKNDQANDECLPP